MENRCCYDCLYHKRPKGISSCKKTKKEIPNPFETVCDKFVCFQCAKHERKECHCYEEGEGNA